MQPGTRKLDVSTLLLDPQLSPRERAECLLPLVYDELRAIARVRMAAERRDHTLDATALVHEAYLRLIGDRDIPWAGRGHFYVAAAEAMRRILIDHARAANRVKRGGGRARLSLLDVADVSELAEVIQEDSSEMMRFDEAFRRLEGESPDAADVVRLRLFAGLSVQLTADALGVSTATVDRRWAFARAWLYRRLKNDG
ncbi:MAG: sigma-70 family RNA polymerase sigma factor [Phycisphaerales bacterium]|nr:sigma-70 family RNA polymerase sigma factor [Phycisphaerales bacterium]